MRILFLDQSGNLGGAELCLLDIVRFFQSHFPNQCLVGLLADGSFRSALEANQIPVQVLTHKTIAVRKESGFIQGLASLKQVWPVITQVTQRAHQYDLIYANTQKALVVGAIASLLSRRPLVYHLHDILSADHFSQTNRWLAIALANTCASLVIANSEATKLAFIEAGGKSNNLAVSYNGFEPGQYSISQAQTTQLRQELDLKSSFVVGHFSRLSPWKGQHILLEALAHCAENVTALFVGDALFGEQAYVEQLQHQVKTLGLGDRVRFLGFRSDIPQLMAACDLIAHTSTAPEPFGRVIVEAMLSARPVVATAAGGATELVTHDQTGWLTPPNDPLKLAASINRCQTHPEQAYAIAQQAQQVASQRFHHTVIHQRLLERLQTLRPRC